MRIGELAAAVGVSTDTVRFYEKSGWLPRATRRENAYREYGPEEVDHLRLLIDLRRLDLPLDDAAQIAAWCHSGHCSDTRSALPSLIAARRAEVAARLARLQDLDTRLEDLQRHLQREARTLTVVNSRGVDATAAPCCDAAGAVFNSVGGGCACCSPDTLH